MFLLPARPTDKGLPCRAINGTTWRQFTMPGPRRNGGAIKSSWVISFGFSARVAYGTAGFLAKKVRCRLRNARGMTRYRQPGRQDDLPPDTVIYRAWHEHALSSDSSRPINALSPARTWIAGARGPVFLCLRPCPAIFRFYRNCSISLPTDRRSGP